MQTAQKQENTRISSFDYIKAFCIFCVCLGHALLFIFTDMDYSYPATKYIYAFHMPLFMTVSGFFFVSSLKKDFATLIKEKSVQLLLPCLSFFLIIKICRLQASLNFWYMKCLFCLYVIYWLLFKIKEKIGIRTGLYCSILAFLFLVLAPFFNRWLFFSYKIMFMFPFFALGIALRRYWTLIQKYEKYIFIASFLISLVALYFWKTEYIIYFTPIRYFSFIGFDKNLLIASVIRLMTGSVISVFLIVFFDVISKMGQYENISSLFFQSVGRHSMQIYLLQSFMLEYSFIDYRKYDFGKIDYKYIGGGLAAIIAIIISMVLAWLVSRNKMLNLILFGKRKK